MILQTILARLAPHECLGCEAEGALLCQACATSLDAVPARCYRCHKLTTGARTCESCRSSSPIFGVHVAYAYRGLAKDIVWQLKFSGAQAAAREMADQMSHLATIPADAVVVPVPTATSRVRRRGFDQAKLLGRSLAVQTGLPYAPVLRRLGQHHQVGATRAQRVTQLRDAYRCAGASRIRGRHVLLIDDVLTTGATLEAAAQALKAAGAARVSAAVFAQA